VASVVSPGYAYVPYWGRLCLGDLRQRVQCGRGSRADDPARACFELSLDNKGVSRRAAGVGNTTVCVLYAMYAWCPDMSSGTCGVWRDGQLWLLGRTVRGSKCRMGRKKVWAYWCKTVCCALIVLDGSRG